VPKHCHRRSTAVATEVHGNKDRYSTCRNLHRAARSAASLQSAIRPTLNPVIDYDTCADLCKPFTTLQATARRLLEMTPCSRRSLVVRQVSYRDGIPNCQQSSMSPSTTPGCTPKTSEGRRHHGARLLLPRKHRNRTDYSTRNMSPATECTAPLLCRNTKFSYTCKLLAARLSFTRRSRRLSNHASAATRNRSRDRQQ